MSRGIELAPRESIFLPVGQGHGRLSSSSSTTNSNSSAVEEECGPLAGPGGRGARRSRYRADPLRPRRRVRPTESDQAPFSSRVSARPRAPATRPLAAPLHVETELEAEETPQQRPAAGDRHGVPDLRRE